MNAVERAAGQAELLPPCVNGQGHHYCTTHDKHFVNNLAANDHDRNHRDCVFAWWCVDHGLERAS